MFTRILVPTDFSTHGRDRMANLLLGSVAEKVVRTAPCPVLTMRESPVAGEPEGLRILVATDFSASSDAALGYAKRLAAKVRGTIRLLHVVVPKNRPKPSRWALPCEC